jgi:disulfide bond formation protein DsbB
MPTLETMNGLVGLGTVALQIATLVLLAAYATRGRFAAARSLVSLAGRWGIILALKLSLVATLAALFYSDVLGIPPCPLCWWQRVFLFPQVVLFALALWRGTRVVAASLALSVLGLAVALYHHALQVLPGSNLPCPAQGVSCAQRIIFEFGYITFPLVAATVFAFLIVLLLCVRAQSRT